MSASSARAAFDSLKADFRDGRLPMLAGRMAGEAAAWGEALLGHFAGADRAVLDSLDSMARFWVLRYRGLPEPADLRGATGGAVFVMAFTAFPYLDVMMDSWELGEAVAEEGGIVCFRCLFEGEDQGNTVTAHRGPQGWCFDLMDLYRAKLAVFDDFISGRFGGFQAFLESYIAEHDLDFHAEQAWSPL